MIFSDETLVGKTVLEIYMNRQMLTFVTDEGKVSFYANGDCCSKSYFFDFYGVENLLGRKVLSFEEVHLSPGDPGYRKRTFDARKRGNPKGKTKKVDESGIVTKVYGYRLTVEHPVFGEVSAIFSFRNDSNGYYGGSLEDADGSHIDDPACKITKDVIG